MSYNQVEQLHAANRHGCGPGPAGATPPHPARPAPRSAASPQKVSGPGRGVAAWWSLACRPSWAARPPALFAHSASLVAAGPLPPRRAAPGRAARPRPRPAPPRLRRSALCAAWAAPAALAGPLRLGRRRCGSGSLFGRPPSVSGSLLRFGWPRRVPPAVLVWGRGLRAGGARRLRRLFCALPPRPFFGCAARACPRLAPRIAGLFFSYRSEKRLRTPDSAERPAGET